MALRLTSSATMVFKTSITSWRTDSRKDGMKVCPAGASWSSMLTLTLSKGESLTISLTNSLTNTSTPAAKLWNANSDGTLFMNKPITNMDVQDGKASFDFMKSATDIGIQTVTGVAQVLCEYGPIRIVRTADGTVKKVMKR